MTLTPTETQFLDLVRASLSGGTGLPEGGNVLPQDAELRRSLRSGAAAEAAALSL